MKKILVVMALCSVWCLVTGCAPKEGALQPETTVMETSVLDSAWTERELLDFFQGYVYADPAERTVEACVVIPDSAYDVYGVVQYTTEDYEGCWFDFIRETKAQTVGVKASPTTEDTLTYKGNDTVCVQLLDEAGETHTYTIVFTDDGERVNFEIKSE